MSSKAAATRPTASTEVLVHGSGTAADAIRARYPDQRAFALESIPLDDPGAYRLMSEGKTVLTKAPITPPNAPANERAIKRPM